MGMSTGYDNYYMWYGGMIYIFNYILFIFESEQGAGVSRWCGRLRKEAYEAHRSLIN